MEVAPFDPSHSTELETTTEHEEGAKTQSAEEQGPTSHTKVDGIGSLVVERQHEGSDSGSPLKSAAGGTDEGAEGMPGRRRNGRSDQRSLQLMERMGDQKGKPGARRNGRIGLMRKLRSC